MRISTSVFYNTSLNGIQNQQSNIARLTQQMSQNKAFLTPKDAPLNASRALDLSNSIALRTQYVANQDKAELSLKFENVHLEQLRSSLKNARTTLGGVSASQTQSLRDQLAIQIGNIYSLVKDIGNARDAEGNYIFSGYETATKPYAHSAIYPNSLPVGANTTSYSGDSGTRQIAIENGRQVQVSDSLEGVFLGNGTPAQDLLGTLDYAATAISDSSASATNVNNAIQTAISAINSSLDALQGVQTRVAGRVIEVNELRDSTRALLTTEQNALGDINDLDTAAAIIELQQRQTNLEASQRTFAMVSGMSLFSYLS
jgi:flagellar hook-associated protein 3 FlgL